jgi:hypothetical protein
MNTTPIHAEVPPSAVTIEQHFSAAQVAGLIGRCPEYVSAGARRGEFGRVFRDARGWIIPASGVRAWLAAREVSPVLHVLQEVSA